MYKHVLAMYIIAVQVLFYLNISRKREKKTFGSMRTHIYSGRRTQIVV
jgi:hypothetical protein